MACISFLEFSLSMFTDDNIKRPNVKFSTKGAKKDADEVANREPDILKLVIALNNFRMVERFHFPGR